MLFFAKATAENCRRDTITDFCDCSGQRINTQKSVIMISKRAKDSRRASLIEAVGLPAGREIGRYLGVPLVTSRLFPSHFAELQNRILARIGGWKNRLQLYFRAGKICLINFSLLPMLFLTLGHCAVPAYIFDWLEKQIRGFLWDHDPDRWKWHYIGWNHLCKPRDFGGAGILNIRCWDKAIIRKQVFRISAGMISGLLLLGTGMLSSLGIIMRYVTLLLVIGRGW